MALATNIRSNREGLAAQKLLEDNSVVVLHVFCTIHERHGSVLDLLPQELNLLVIFSNSTKIPLPEPLPLTRIMTKPFPGLCTGSYSFDPKAGFARGIQERMLLGILTAFWQLRTRLPRLCFEFVC